MTTGKTIMATRAAGDKDEAVRKKIEGLRGKIFGIPLVRFEVVSQEDVFVPYMFLLYDFNIPRKSMSGKEKPARRSGRVAVIFDCNEVHAVECDIEEMGCLDVTEKAVLPEDGTVMEKNCTASEARERCETFIQNRILRRLYASAGELHLGEEIRFYRPARRIGIRYRGSDVVNYRFAYYDSYAVENEHILGLKVRMNG